MVDIDEVDERLRAVERALTDDGRDGTAPEDVASLAARLDAVEEQVDALTDRVDELAASTQAVRGYVGNVRSVNRDIEQRADAALAAVESLETRVEESNGESQGAESRHEPRQRTGRPHGAGGTDGAGSGGTDQNKDVAGRTARRVMAEAADRNQTGGPGDEPPRRQRRRGGRPPEEDGETDRTDDGGLLAGLRGTL
jgi:hypothetical protein